MSAQAQEMGVSFTQETYEALYAHPFLLLPDQLLRLLAWL